MTDPVAMLMALAAGQAAPTDADDGVTRLPMGATRRNPDGYPSEAAYLAAVRGPMTMRLHPGSRRKSRFDSIPPRDGSRSARERIGGREYRARVIERRIDAELWGVPNLIVGP